MKIFRHMQLSGQHYPKPKYANVVTLINVDKLAKEITVRALDRATTK